MKIDFDSISSVLPFVIALWITEIEASQDSDPRQQLGTKPVHDSIFHEFSQHQELIQPQRFPQILDDDDINRIIGGQEAKSQEFPSIISVQYFHNKTYHHACTGSIVNVDWILTAGHCSTIGPAAKYRIIAGGHNLENYMGTEQIRKVKDVQTHPKYSRNTIDYDIAMMMVTEPFEFNEFVKPVVLVPEEFIAKDFGIAAGWGLTKKGSDTIPAKLQKITLPIVEWQECKGIYDKFNIQSKVTQRMICAGGEQGKNVCHGDSGGPLYTYTYNKETDGVKDSDQGDLTLAGLTSWGLGCADLGWPGVFTNVSYFHKWIQCNSKHKSPMKIDNTLVCLLESGEKLPEDETPL